MIACFVLLPCVGAADGTVFGMALEALPTDYEYHIRDGATRTSGEDAYDLGVGATVGLRLDAPIAQRLTASFAVEAVVGAYSASGGDRLLTGLGRVVLGYAYHLDSAWNIGIEGWGGTGYAALDIAGVAGAPDAAVSGSLVQFGARLVSDYDVGGWWVRAGLGWQRDESQMDGDGLAVELTQAGPVVLIGLGWAF